MTLQGTILSPIQLWIVVTFAVAFLLHVIQTFKSPKKSLEKRAPLPFLSFFKKLSLSSLIACWAILHFLQERSAQEFIYRGFIVSLTLFSALYILHSYLGSRSEYLKGKVFKKLGQVCLIALIPGSLVALPLFGMIFFVNGVKAPLIPLTILFLWKEFAGNFFLIDETPLSKLKMKKISSRLAASSICIVLLVTAIHSIGDGAPKYLQLTYIALCILIVSAGNLLNHILKLFGNKMFIQKGGIIIRKWKGGAEEALVKDVKWNYLALKTKINGEICILYDKKKNVYKHYSLTSVMHSLQSEPIFLQFNTEDKYEVITEIEQRIAGFLEKDAKGWEYPPCDLDYIRIWKNQKALVVKGWRRHKIREKKTTRSEFTREIIQNLEGIEGLEILKS